MVFSHRFALPQNPIFIVGYPRSGTTILLGLLITQTPLYSFPETHYFCVIEKWLRFDKRGNVLSSCLDDVFEKVHEKMAFRFSEEESNIIFRLAKRKKLDSKVLFECIVSRFLRRQINNPDKPVSFRWIEKTPVHFNFIDRIIEFYPKAQILHILRHPVPSVFSRKLKFPFNKELPITILAERWNRMTEIMDTFNARFPDHIYTLRYEDLLSDMENEFEALGDFLDIPLDLSLVSNYHQSSKSIILPSEAWKYDSPENEFVNTNETYKNTISESEVRTIETIVSDKMKKFGYSSYLNKEESLLK